MRDVRVVLYEFNVRVMPPKPLNWGRHTDAEPKYAGKMSRHLINVAAMSRAGIPIGKRN